MQFNLADRVFLIAGGSKGLGRATADALVAEGAKVALVARDEATLLDAVQTLGGDVALPIVGDIGDPELPARAVAAAHGKFGRLDGALVNTGGPPIGRASELGDEAWRAAFDAVFLPSVRLARAVAADVLHHRDHQPSAATGASIVMVLSTSVYRPLANLALSNGLRPGLANLVREFAAEWGPYGIRVNGVAPGRIATDRVFVLDARGGSPNAVRRRHEATIPLRRYGQPPEFGRVAAFLLSDAASYITGTVIPVDGGATAVG